MKNKKIKNLHELKELHALEARLLAIDNEIKEIQSMYDKKGISYNEYSELYYDALDKKESLCTYTKKEVDNIKVNYLCAGIVIATLLFAIVERVMDRT